MQTIEKLVDSFFYGYINGDVLLSESVFTFLETVLANQQGHDLLNPGCLFAGRVSEVANMTEFDMSSQTASIDFGSYYHQGSLRNRYSSVSSILFVLLIGLFYLSWFSVLKSS